MKHKFKRGLSLLLSCALLLTLLPAAALAATTTKALSYSQYVYEYNPISKQWTMLGSTTEDGQALAAAIKEKNLSISKQSRLEIGTSINVREKLTEKLDSEILTLAYTYNDKEFSWQCVGYSYNGNNDGLVKWKEDGSNNTITITNASHATHGLIYYWVPVVNDTVHDDTVSADSLEKINCTYDFSNAEFPEGVKFYGSTSSSTLTTSHIQRHPDLLTDGAASATELTFSEGTQSIVAASAAGYYFKPTSLITDNTGNIYQKFYAAYETTEDDGRTYRHFYMVDSWLCGEETAPSTMKSTVDVTFTAVWKEIGTIDMYAASHMTPSFISTTSDDTENFSQARALITCPVAEEVEKGSSYTILAPTGTGTDSEGRPMITLKDEDDNVIATWVCTGCTWTNLQYYSNQFNIEGKAVSANIGDTITVPGTNLGGTQNTTLSITYQWSLVGHTVSYDLNISDGETTADNQLPKGASVWYTQYSAEDGFVSFTGNNTFDSQYFKTLTVSEGASFTVAPQYTKQNNNAFYGYIAGFQNEDGTCTYYRLLGWSDGTETYEQGSTATMGSEDMALKAQWEAIDPSEYAVNSEDENFPTLTLATNANTALVTQHKTGSTIWTADQEDKPLVLDNDLQVYYQATLQMTYEIAYMLKGQAIVKENFANFDIHVDLDDTLELVDTDGDGYIEFSFTSTFLRPVTNSENKALIKDKDGNELDYYEVTETSSSKTVSGSLVFPGNETYNVYTYTFKVDKASLENKFIIPMEWRPTETGYGGKALQNEMKLEVAVAQMTDTTKVVATGGEITGEILFENAINKEGKNLVYNGYGFYAGTATALKYYSDWRDYCWPEGDTDDILGFLKALNCVDTAARNTLMPGNTVYAKAPSYTVTVNYLDNSTKEAIAETYVTTEAVVGSEYDVTAQDQIAIDGYTYSHTDGDATTGTLDGHKVVNVYYIRGEGALEIKKAVTGTQTDEDFEFTVTLLDGGEPLTGTYYYTGTKAGSITLNESGSATVSLSSEDHISINNLPAGVTYEVQEVNVPEQYMVTFQGHDATGSGNYVTGEVKGKVVGGSGAVVTCVNTYQPVYYTVTVRYLEKGTERVLCEPVEIRQETGTSYDATVASQRYISGYVLDQITGDPLKGTLDKDKVITVYYVRQTVTPVVPVDPPVTPVTPVQPSVPSLNTEDHVAYIIGYPDGTVRPSGNITRAEVATIFFRLLTDETRAAYWSQTNPYSDVAAAAWYNNAISTLSNMGIVDGYPDGSFRPNASITRAELTKIAVSFFEYADKNYAYKGEYSDVSGNEWYAGFVAAANALGLIEGYPDGTFLPNNPITRAETCTIVNRTLGRKPHEDHLLGEQVMITWPDNIEGVWYYEQMQEATNSHDYAWTAEDGDAVENWTAKPEERDWAALERVWSNAYSAPGGEVMD